MSLFSRILANRPRWLCLFWAWFDYQLVLPRLARLPRTWARVPVVLRGVVNFLFDMEWRTLARGHGYVRGATYKVIRSLGFGAPSAALRTLQRFCYCSWEEYDAERLARGDVADISGRLEGVDDLLAAARAGRGVVLLMAHFDSFCVGLVLLSRLGLTINLMSSDIVNHPRVPRPISRYFTRKYEGMSSLFSPGRVVHHEGNLRFFLAALTRGEIVVIACDGTGKPGRNTVVDFLGASRAMARGPEFLARETDALVASYVCRRSDKNTFELAVSPLHPVAAGGIQKAYDFLDDRIRAEPERWWASDLCLHYLSPASGSSAPANAAEDA